MFVWGFNELRLTEAQNSKASMKLGNRSRKEEQNMDFIYRP